MKPVNSNLQRLFDTEVMSLSRLLACPFAPKALKQAAIADHPADVEERRRDLASAVRYELGRYGCILLAENPYHQPAMYADERKAA